MYWRELSVKDKEEGAFQLCRRLDTRDSSFKKAVAKVAPYRKPKSTEMGQLIDAFCVQSLAGNSWDKCRLGRIPRGGLPLGFLVNYAPTANSLEGDLSCISVASTATYSHTHCHDDSLSFCISVQEISDHWISAQIFFLSRISCQWKCMSFAKCYLKYWS